MEEKEKILEVSHLKKYFKTGRGTLKAVDDVSFFIRRGETLGIVGESGCGKTTCGRTCIGILGRTDGHVLYKGKGVHSLRGKERKEFTKEAQIIFQDPYSSLDPKMKVGDIIARGAEGPSYVQEPGRGAGLGEGAFGDRGTQCRARHQVRP